MKWQNRSWYINPTAILSLTGATWKIKLVAPLPLPFHLRSLSNIIYRLHSFHLPSGRCLPPMIPHILSCRLYERVNAIQPLMQLTTAPSWSPLVGHWEQEHPAFMVNSITDIAMVLCNFQTGGSHVLNQEQFDSCFCTSWAPNLQGFILPRAPAVKRKYKEIRENGVTGCDQVWQCLILHFYCIICYRYL